MRHDVMGNRLTKPDMQQCVLSSPSSCAYEQTVTLSQMRSKPPVKESSNKLLRKTDGTNLGGTIHEVQTIGKNAKKQKALCSTGVLQG